MLASNGEEALKALDSEDNIDLVLLDIKMPGMDGVEVLRRVKEKNKGYAGHPLYRLSPLQA